MAVVVIDGLEVVQVEVAHRQLGAVAPGTLQLLAQTLTQQGAIGQAGERILVGHLTQLLVDQTTFEPLGKAAHHDREHGHLLVAPAAAAADVVEAGEPLQLASPHQGEHQKRLNALGVQQLPLGARRGRKIIQRLEIDRPSGPHFPHPPAGPPLRQGLEQVDLRFHPGGTPFVGVAGKPRIPGQGEHIGPVHIEQAADGRQGAINGGVQFTGGLDDERLSRLRQQLEQLPAEIALGHRD